MAPEGSSFIPKSGVKTVQRTRGNRRIYVLAYISYIVFFSTLFSVIGVYLYGAMVSRELTSLREQLVVERQRFSLEEIEDVQRLDERLTTATQILNQSSAPSRIFGDIEAIVASNIYFSGFHYEHLPNNQFKIDLTGRADTFNEIISQRSLLGNSNLLKDATVVDFDYSVDEDTEAVASLGQATFSFIFSDTRDISSIAYIPAQTEGDSSTQIPANAENIVVSGSATSTQNNVNTTIINNIEDISTSTMEINQ